jgi:hypothetical protein
MAMNDRKKDLKTQPPMPLWVKIFGIIVLCLVALFVILHLTGRGLGGH